jgi:peptidoglycan/LPS O-acetylase OafA/YrhL
VKKSRSDIHLLRAVSLILVLLFHAEIPPFRGGFIGVDVFFLISGYLVTHAIDKPNIQISELIKGFYARRVRRIAPALLATISIAIPFALKLMYPVQLSMFSQSIVATIFNLSNIYFLLTGGYFGPNPKLNPLLHTWSIGVEMQFYFLFPLIFWSIRNFGLKVRITAIAMLAILSLAAAEILAQNLGYLFGFFMMPTRLWQFLIGSLVYLGTNNKHYASSL